MVSQSGRLLGRGLRDVTRVTAEELRSSPPPLRLVTEEIPENTPVETAAPIAAPIIAPATCHVICIASGKGGTGKTVFTTNLAVALARLGLRTVLFDADMGLANAHLLLGTTPQEDISAVLARRCRLLDIATECSENLRLVSGGSGFSELSELSGADLRHLANEIGSCEATADLIFVDLSAGIHPQVLRFLTAAHRTLLVTTPDPTALLDAYATIKALVKRDGAAAVEVIVNRAKDRRDAIEAFKKIQTVAATRLAGAAISFFGWLPQNWYVQDAVARREPVVTLHPKSFVAGSFASMAGRIAGQTRMWKAAQSAATTTNEECDAPFSMALAQTVEGGA